jgi:hypothetical protein
MNLLQATQEEVISYIQKLAKQDQLKHRADSMLLLRTNIERMWEEPIYKEEIIETIHDYEKLLGIHEEDAHATQILQKKEIDLQKIHESIVGLLHEPISLEVHSHVISLSKNLYQDYTMNKLLRIFTDTREVQELNVIVQGFLHLVHDLLTNKEMTLSEEDYHACLDFYEQLYKDLFLILKELSYKRADHAFEQYLKNHNFEGLQALEKTYSNQPTDVVKQKISEINAILLQDGLDLQENEKEQHIIKRQSQIQVMLQKFHKSIQSIKEAGQNSSEYFIKLKELEIIQARVELLLHGGHDPHALPQNTDLVSFYTLVKDYVYIKNLLMYYQKKLEVLNGMLIDKFYINLHQEI